MIGVANGIKLFDFAQPTARSMKTDRGGMLAADSRQSFFVRLPLAAQVVNGLRRCGHDAWRSVDCDDLALRLYDSQQLLTKFGIKRNQFHLSDLVYPSLEELVIEPILPRKLLKRV